MTVQKCCLTLGWDTIGWDNISPDVQILGIDLSLVGEYVLSESFMYGSLRRRFWDEKHKMADNVHVAMESPGDQFVLRLYND